MSLIYKVKKCDGRYETNDSMLSSNIEQMRNEIKNLIDKNYEKVLYSNPIRFMIKDKSDEIDNEDKSESEIKIESSQTLSERNNAEIVELMKKELKQFDFVGGVELMTESQIKESDYGFNFETMNENHAFIIPPINLNTRKFVHVLDMLGNLFSPVYVMKSSIDDAYTERIIIIVGKRTSEDKPDSQAQSNNQSSFIDFLYTVYSRSLFVLKSDEEEYKQFTKACVNVFRKVEMI